LSSRHSSVRITLYNHKGGVGKTTLLINIAAALALLGKRVLLVDADPQCNLTSYLVESNVIDDWLDKSETANGSTIWTALKPISDGVGKVKRIKAYERQEGVFLIPGDLRLSQYEQDLNHYWVECFQHKPHGFMAISAISELVNQIAASKNIDFIFYDIGPNVGALNKIILLDCDYFIVPAACDLFSVRALKTLGLSLKTWISQWQVLTQIAPDNTVLLPGKPKFLGYILQRFKMYGGSMAEAFTSYAAKLEKAAHSEIVTVLRKIDKSLARTSLSQNRLGQVKDFSSIVPKSQSQGEPFFNVEGGNSQLKYEAKQEFLSIAKNIITLIGTTSTE
jgi:cellulose biosynthesis protein BcsQ